MLNEKLIIKKSTNIYIYKLDGWKGGRRPRGGRRNRGGFAGAAPALIIFKIYLFIYYLLHIAPFKNPKFYIPQTKSNINLKIKKIKKILINENW